MGDRFQLLEKKTSCKLLFVEVKIYSPKLRLKNFLRTEKHRDLFLVVVCSRIFETKTALMAIS